MNIDERCRELEKKLKERQKYGSSTHVRHDGFTVVTVKSPPPRKITERYIVVDGKDEKIHLPTA